MTEPRVEPYRNNDEYLAEELAWLDQLLRLRIAAFRLRLQAVQQVATSPTMYISQEEVDWLLDGAGATVAEPAGVRRLRRQLRALEARIQARITCSLEQEVYLALPHLADLFRLSAFETRVLVICLAPELDRKYDTLYAYLQDDITRKRPRVDLVLDLLCDTAAARRAGGAAFASPAALMRSGILESAGDPASPSGASGLARFLGLDARILHFLLRQSYVDGRLLGLVHIDRAPTVDGDILVDPDIQRRTIRLVEHHYAAPLAQRERLVLYLHGPHGVGKHKLALQVCAHLGCHLVSLDLEALLLQGPEVEALLRLAFREALLRQAALYLQNGQALQRDEAQGVRKALAQATAEYGWLVFIGSDQPWAPPGGFEHAVFHPVELPMPDVTVRRAAWVKSLAPFGAPAGWSVELAGQFRLTPGRIEDAVTWAAMEVAARAASPELGLTDLYQACRQQSRRRLGDLAVTIDTRAGWDALVLPDDQIAQLREICSQVRHHHQVFGDWGFDQKASRRTGVSALFSGLPGTGKTLAAEVVAHELQLDLYKVDLSGVVSKYVGETEKNLARIFQEAETSNAILFFDEADALFGKRTEVSDAHDRYANIETSYLLQRMEAYAGIVILATNLRENMDEAFMRRLRFVVEFPFPDEASRRRIWATHFPARAPISSGVDLDYLARELKIAGGNISTIVLNAAFLAGADRKVVGMEHLSHATRREFAKLGKVWSDAAAAPAGRRRG